MPGMGFTQLGPAAQASTFMTLMSYEDLFGDLVSGHQAGPAAGGTSHSPFRTPSVVAPPSSTVSGMIRR